MEKYYKFWFVSCPLLIDRLRDSIATRRVDILYDAVMDIVPPPQPKRVRKRNKPAVPASDDDDFMDATAVLDPGLSPPKRRKRSSGALNLKNEFGDAVSSDGETDDVIEGVIKKLYREKQRMLEKKPSQHEGHGTKRIYNSPVIREIRHRVKISSVDALPEPEEKVSILAGLDLENDDDAAMIALDRASVAAKKMIKMYSEFFKT